MTADQISPNKEAVVIKEDQNVALSCSYETSSAFAYLYWYRQYPRGELLYLIHSSKSSSKQSGRFHLTTSGTSSELSINGVTLSDSALYYCALREAAQ